MSLRVAFLSHLDRNLYRFRLPVMRALVERGVKVYALCPPGPLAERFAEHGVIHVSYAIDRGGLNPFKELGVVAAIARRLKELSPDLLHSFMMKPNIYGAFAAAWSGVPRRAASVTGLGSFYTDAGRPGLRRRAMDRLYRAALRRVDRVIFYNEDDLNELVRLGVCAKEKALLIRGSGVDVSRFRPRPGPRPEGPVKVTMAARLIRHKGVEEYLAAAEALKRRYGDGVVFQLAGEPDEGNPWAVPASRIAESHARGAIKPLGFVERIETVLQDSDIYVLPSYREGMPVSVLEAMSSGLAVVTTRAPGCRDAVEDGISGLLVPPRDAEALAAAVARLIEDRRLRQRLGDTARLRVERLFSVEAAVAAHLAIYRELLPGRGL